MTPALTVADVCAHCRQPSDALLTDPDGRPICLDCRTASAYSAAGFDQMQPLEQRYMDGDR